MRRKALTFEEYWLASKAWERRGISLGTARSLVNAGFLTVDDLRTAYDLEIAAIPRVGSKSIAILYALIDRKMPQSSGKQQPRKRVLPARSGHAVAILE
jgi:hypothetical protein